jgi:hypothetical protein
MRQNVQTAIGLLTGGAQNAAVNHFFRIDPDRRKLAIRQALLVRLANDDVEGLLSEQEIADYVQG